VAENATGAVPAAVAKSAVPLEPARLWKNRTRQNQPVSVPSLAEIQLDLGRLFQDHKGAI
jgi:hypothetical protein